MKTITLVLLFAASAAASGSASFRMDPSPTHLVRERIPIVRFSQDIRTGHDAVTFETGNGISVSDQTQVVQGRGGHYEDGRGKLIKTDSSVVKTGSYTYTSPEGLPITVNWVADEGGFRATGDHLPTTAAPASLPVREDHF